MITDINLMYIYCESVIQLEPKSILDVGLFYKAIGGVSRNILDREISNDIKIVGADTQGKDSLKGLGVYNTIYNEIKDISEIFAANSEDTRFDMGILLSDAVNEAVKARCVKKMFEICDYIIALESDIGYFKNAADVRSLKLENAGCIAVKTNR